MTVVRKILTEGGPTAGRPVDELVIGVGQLLAVDAPPLLGLPDQGEPGGRGRAGGTETMIYYLLAALGAEGVEA